MFVPSFLFSSRRAKKAPKPIPSIKPMDLNDFSRSANNIYVMLEHAFRGGCERHLCHFLAPGMILSSIYDAFGSLFRP